MRKQQYPSALNRPFYLKMNDMPFKKGDLISTNNSYNLKVLKRYKNTWIKRLLRRLGLKIRINEYKVIKTN